MSGIDTKILSGLTNNTCTKNGDVALFSTGNANLDLFSTMGALRNNNDREEKISALFAKAMDEDAHTAVKNLLFMRDIRKGLGERDTFRDTFKYLAQRRPDIAAKLIRIIPQIGRFDDLFCLMDTPVESALIDFIRERLNEDLKLKGEGKPISLLAKWMPSINTSSDSARKLAKRLALALNMGLKEYRQTLSLLRKGIQIETNLTEKDYSFDYSAVPSQAMAKYAKAFRRHDEKRFEEYLADVESGKSKINAGTLYPYQIAYRADASVKDALWNNLNRTAIPEGTIVVRDGSRSMDGFPEQVATSLAILFGECLKGSMHNSFITFSRHPRLVAFPDGKLDAKIKFVSTYDECQNTDILKVYQLLLDYELKRGAADSRINRVIIISDMEFDKGVKGTSTFNTMLKRFQKNHLEPPQLVYWNVQSSNIHFAVDSNSGALLVSGCSDHLINFLVESSDTSPVAFMDSTLSIYSFVDELF